jgi:hypothetical protein
MRKTIFFSFMLFLLITACNKSVEYETLSARWPVFGDVYVLKDEFPDSAMMLMQSVTDILEE